MVKSRILPMALVVVLGACLQAHDLAPEVQMYFKVQGSTLRVLARLPLATLLDAQLPLVPGGTLDLEGSRPKLAAAAADFVRTADIADMAGAAGNIDERDGRPALTAGAIDWRVSNQDNLAFMSYDIADAYLSAPLEGAAPEGTGVDAGRGFLDLRVDFPLQSSAPRLQARFNTLRVGGAFVPTRATYITGDGEVRPFFVRGAPVRVAFEPTPGAAAGRFASLGASRLSLEQGLLLFLFVLAVPRRPVNEALQLLVTTLAGFAVATVAVLYATAVDARVTGAAALVAAMLLAVAALQNLTTVRPTWTRAVALLMGLAAGVSAGAAAQDMISFAGFHQAIGAALFLGVIAAGCAAAFAAFQVGVLLFRRLPLSPQVAAILLSLLPLHTALHAMASEGEKLAEWTSTDAGAGWWTTTLDYWPPLAAVLGILVLAGIRALARGHAVEHPEAG